MKLMTVCLIVIGLAVTACDYQNAGNMTAYGSSTSGAPGYADLIVALQSGSTGQCPGGYNMISSYTMNSCTNVVPAAAPYAACTVSYCALPYVPGQTPQSGNYVVTDVQFVNHAENATAITACPKTYQSIIANNPNGLYWPYNPSYGGDMITDICVQYQAPGAAAPVTKFYTNDTSCAAGEVSFSGYRWDADGESTATYYCVRH